MGTEIENAAEIPLHVVEPVGEPPGNLGHQKVVGGKSGGGAVAVAAHGAAIEDGHRHGIYMTPAAASAKPSAGVEAIRRGA